MVDKSVVEDFLKAIQPADKNTDHTYNATVTRVDKDGVVWVQVAGSDKETPTSSTSSEVKRGDAVNVQWRNNKLYVAGNYTNPSAGSVRVRAVEVAAKVANQAASNAVADAGIARQAAESAQSDAARAKSAADGASEYAARAFGNLSTVQSITETLTWITQHGTMTLTTDVALDPTHVYFVQDAGGDYVVGGVTYAVVTEPDVADIATYYELSVDESLNNYVGTHLALTSEGLWLLPASTGTSKVLIATGAGTQYTTAGTYIIDTDGTTVLARFTASGVVIGQNDDTRLYVDNDSVFSTNARGFSTFEINSLPSGTYNNKGEWFEYNNESPFECVFRWNCTSINNNVQCYDSSFNRIVGLNPQPTLSNNTAIFDATQCAQLQNNSVKYILMGYTAVGAFPYFTFGERGAGTIGKYSTCIGETCVASNDDSYAEGYDTKASGVGAHAEGNGANASGGYSHAEGYDTKASGAQAHSEGHGSIASGSIAHAEGFETTASGYASHAEGLHTVASKYYSHAQNCYTIAGSESQTALGAFNVEDIADTYAVIVGNGTADNARSNALTVDWNGNITINNHDSEIGHVYSASKSVTISNTGIDDNTDGASLTLSAGVYIVIGQWQFNTRTTTGTTNNAVRLYEGSNLIGQVREVAGAANWNSMQCCAIVETVGTSTTLKVCGASSRPYTAASTTYIKAVRIK